MLRTSYSTRVFGKYEHRLFHFEVKVFYLASETNVRMQEKKSMWENYS